MGKKKSSKLGGNWGVGVKAILMTRNASKFLLIKEAVYDGGANPGKWDCPGGTMIMGECVHKTLARELKEEIGVAIDELEFSRQNVCYISGNINSKTRLFIPATVLLPSGISLSKDHSEYKWATIEDVIVFEEQGLMMPDQTKFILNVYARRDELFR